MSSTPPKPPDEQPHRRRPALETDYQEIKHSLGTQEVEQKSPPQPPPKDTLGANRSYQLQLASDQDFWASDPVRQISGVKRNKKDSRTDEQKTRDEAIETQAWRDGVKQDIFHLWNSVCKHPDDSEAIKAGKEDVRRRFFAVCRERLEGIEVLGERGVGMMEFQEVVRGVLVELRLKLAVEGFGVLTVMATEKRVKKEEEDDEE